MSHGKIDSLEYLCMRDVLADLGRVAVIALRGINGSLDKVVFYGNTTPASIKGVRGLGQVRRTEGIYYDLERGFAADTSLSTTSPLSIATQSRRKADGATKKRDFGRVFHLNSIATIPSFSIFSCILGKE
jgi:hypothetical protein